MANFSLQFHHWIKHIKIMRIKEMIANHWSSWLLNKFTWLVMLEMYREQYGEYVFWRLGMKG